MSNFELLWSWERQKIYFYIATEKYTIYSRKYAYAVTQETNLAAVICRN